MRLPCSTAAAFRSRRRVSRPEQPKKGRCVMPALSRLLQTHSHTFYSSTSPCQHSTPCLRAGAASYLTKPARGQAGKRGA